MFSYGSGCAASMFVLRFTADYKKIAAKTTSYKQKLAQRIKVDPKDYDKIMAARQEMFGKKDYSPKVCLSHKHTRLTYTFLGLNCYIVGRHVLLDSS
jgi:3-hydroxy-3-methylglutaryl CoA synthase